MTATLSPRLLVLPAPRPARRRTPIRRLPQAEDVYCTYYTLLRSFVASFSRLVFLDASPYCADLCSRLVEHCVRFMPQARVQATAMLYLLIRVRANPARKLAPAERQRLGPWPTKRTRMKLTRLPPSVPVHKPQALAAFGVLLVERPPTICSTAWMMHHYAFVL